MKFDKYKKYCMICHDVYPYPLYNTVSNGCGKLDGWVFITLHFTHESLAYLDGIQTPLICWGCIHKIDMPNIAKQIEDFKIWLGGMVSEYDAGKVVEFERVK